MDIFFLKQTKLGAIFWVAMIITACGNPNEAYEYRLDGELSSNNIPSSVNAAFGQLDMLLPEQAKHDLASCSKGVADEYCRQFQIHFRISLERQIRNAWFRDRDSELWNQMSENGITDPELMASRLLEIYLQQLNTNPGKGI